VRCLIGFSFSLLISIVAGCAKYPSGHLLSQSQKDVVVASSDVVFFGTIRQNHSGPNPVFPDDYLAPQVPHPRNGFTQTLTIDVDRVEKGQYPDPSIEVFIHRGPYESFYPSNIPIVMPGRRVWVGLTDYSLGHYRSAQIIPTDDIDYLRTIHESHLVARGALSGVQFATFRARLRLIDGVRAHHWTSRTIEQIPP
jgi:hypothetical protein